MNYRIGTFNCKNYIYGNNPEKFDWIKEIIEKANVNMLLLQEFATSGNRKDSLLKNLPFGWDAVLYHGFWKENKIYEKILKKLPAEPLDDTNGEYRRNPNNDNGYAILWNTGYFSIMDLSDRQSVQNILMERTTDNNLARPPQIEFFSLKENRNRIFAVINTHLTYSGKYDLYADRLAKNAFKTYDQSSKEIKARVDEMNRLLHFYDLVNNQASINGTHYTTILGGDFNLSQNIIEGIEGAPYDTPSTTNQYNEYTEANRRDSTAEFNHIYALNVEKSTLHKIYNEKPDFDYKYHSYDHFIINQENCRTEVFDSVRNLKDFFDESKDKKPKNDEHYAKLSDHLPVIVNVNL